MNRRWISCSLAFGLVILAVARVEAALESRTWKVDGQERTALVAIPEPKPTKPAPLVFVFHGHGGNGRFTSRGFRIHELWPEAVVVYPNGLPTPGALTDPEGKRAGWQSRVGDQDDRDLKFVDTMLADLKKTLPIDDRRIYSTGHSNGGGFTYLLTVARPGVLAAAAPSAAVLGVRAGRPKPVPILHFAGRNDPLVKFNWQKLMMESVRKINGCEADGTPWGGDPQALLYRSPEGNDVVCVIHDSDHRLMRGAPELIVKFFQEHTKPEKGGSTAPKP